MAKYRAECLAGSGAGDNGAGDWASFLGDHATDAPTRFEPCEKAAAVYDESYARHCRLMKVQPDLDEAVAG